MIQDRSDHGILIAPYADVLMRVARFLWGGTRNKPKNITVSSAPLMHNDLSDLGSVIRIQVTP